MAQSLNGDTAYSVPDEEALKFLDGGFTVKLSIHRWTGKVALTAQDLGIGISVDPALAKVQRELLTLGDKLLMPADIFSKVNSKDTQIRDNFADFALDSEAFGFFFTNSSYSGMLRKHEPLAEKYLEYGEVLSEERYYAAMLDKVAQDYEKLGTVAHRRMVAQRLTDQSLSAFLYDYVSAVMAKFPTREYIKESFKVKLVPRRIKLFEMLKEGEGIALDTLDPELQAKRRVAQYWEQNGKAEIDALIKESVVKVRETLYKAVSHAGSVVRRSGKVHPKTMQGLRETITMIREIDPYQDGEVKRMLSVMDKATNSYDSDQNVSEALRQLEVILADSLVQLGRRESVNGEIGIPSASAVDSARRSARVDAVGLPTFVESAVYGRRATVENIDDDEDGEGFTAAPIAPTRRRQRDDI